jgi:hypothetical protein
MVHHFYLHQCLQRTYSIILFPVELHVKTVKYFKSIEFVQDEVERSQRELKLRGKITEEQIGSME